MKLHPQAIAIVARLIEQRRAGDKPFGIPLEVWRDAIEQQRRAAK